jgi:hypothetical protein
MDTQNVSAQLYFKQLPEDPSTTKYNCQDTYPNLSTCTNSVATDAQIENAFQKQLNLSEYYKSPEVFDTMKRDFMDQTMEGQLKEPPENQPQAQPRPPSVPTKIPVGPTDFLNRFIKESFGSTSIGNIIGYTLISIFALIVVVCLIMMIFF